MNIIFILITLIISVSVGVGFGYKLKVNTLRAEENSRQQEEEAQLKELLKNKELKEKENQELDNAIQNKLFQIQQAEQEKQEILDKMFVVQRETADQAFSCYVDTLEKHMEEVDQQCTQKQQELKNLEDTRAARIAAFLREKEIAEQSQFYRINLSTDELKDIQFLESIKNDIHRPEILCKLIWTSYYQTKTNDLCHNVLGDKIVTGIYKITALDSGLIYIGQSVDIAKRWKDHIKGSLGASAASVNNKLYLTMQEQGIHNFTFELLEQCSPSQLNQKEKEFIALYQSNIFGLNLTKGNK